jgi:hypothetical protein
MEFEGRITKVLPVRSGTSQRGNEWKALPFVFAYYENPDQRWEDKVLLETFDTNQMAQIAKYCEIGADGKVVVENGSVKLKTLDIKCKCGFSHNVKDVARRDGSGTATLNEMRCYKLEIIGQTQQLAPAPQSQQQPGNVLGGPQTPPYNPQQTIITQTDNFGYPIQTINPGDDDLPF